MKKEEFKQKIDDVLAELAERIAYLESKAEDFAGNAREEYEKQVQNLKAIKENLSAKMDEYELLTDGKWDAVRNSAVEFATAVAAAWKESYAKIAEAFRKDDGGNKQKEA